MVVLTDFLDHREQLGQLGLNRRVAEPPESLGRTEQPQAKASTDQPVPASPRYGQCRDGSRTVCADIIALRAAEKPTADLV